MSSFEFPAIEGGQVRFAPSILTLIGAEARGCRIEIHKLRFRDRAHMNHFAPFQILPPNPAGLHHREDDLVMCWMPLARREHDTVSPEPYCTSLECGEPYRTISIVPLSKGPMLTARVALPSRGQRSNHSSHLSSSCWTVQPRPFKPLVDERQSEKNDATGEGPPLLEARTAVADQRPFPVFENRCRGSMA